MTTTPEKTDPLTSEGLLIAIEASIEAFEKSEYDAALERRRAGIELIISANEEVANNDAEFKLQLDIASAEGERGLYTTLEENFSRTCDSAAEAFPSVNPTDAEILGNTATPDLIRYVLAAFKRYKKTKNLATAFNVKQQRRGPRDRFKELSFEMTRAAGSRYFEARTQNANPKEAFIFAVDAAYKRYREGKDDEQEEREMRLVKSEIRKLISHLPSAYDLKVSSAPSPYDRNPQDLPARFNRMMDSADKSPSMP